MKVFLEKNERIKLHKMLNRSMIAQINNDWKQTARPTDTPRYSYIIELRNNETIEINTNDQHPILDKLSNYLVNIFRKIEAYKNKRKTLFCKTFRKPNRNCCSQRRISFICISK